MLTYRDALARISTAFLERRLGFQTGKSQGMLIYSDGSCCPAGAIYRVEYPRSGPQGGFIDDLGNLVVGYGPSQKRLPIKATEAEKTALIGLVELHDSLLSGGKSEVQMRNAEIQFGAALRIASER